MEEAIDVKKNTKLKPSLGVVKLPSIKRIVVDAQGEVKRIQNKPSTDLKLDSVRAIPDDPHAINVQDSILGKNSIVLVSTFTHI